MQSSILFNKAGNLFLLFLIFVFIAFQWFIFFFFSIFQHFGLFSSSQKKQITKIPIISGLVSPQTIPDSLRHINASNPNLPDYIKIAPSNNQTQGLTFSLSLWLNIKSLQQNQKVSGQVIFYKGSITKNQKLQFFNSQGLFHIDVSISSSTDSSKKKFFSVLFSNPNDNLVLNLIDAIQNKLINFIVLISELDNFYKISYNSDNNSLSLYSQVQSTDSINLSSFKVLKFAGFQKIQDVQTTSTYKPYQIGSEYSYKTPLLRFGDSINDLLLEFNDNSTLNSYYVRLFSKDSQPYTINFDKFFHLAITFGDHIDPSSKKRVGTDIQWFINGVFYNAQTFDAHIHFNYGDFYIFPYPSSDYVITTPHNYFPDLQLADLTFYRQTLSPTTIRSIFKAGHSTKSPVLKPQSTKDSSDIKLYTQNYNNI